MNMWEKRQKTEVNMYTDVISVKNLVGLKQYFNLIFAALFFCWNMGFVCWQSGWMKKISSVSIVLFYSTTWVQLYVEFSNVSHFIVNISFYLGFYGG